MAADVQETAVSSSNVQAPLLAPLLLCALHPLPSTVTPQKPSRVRRSQSSGATCTLLVVIVKIASG